MARGSRRFRGDDEYIFVDGRALKADETIHIDVDVPGEAVAEQAPKSPLKDDNARLNRLKQQMAGLDDAQALDLREDAINEILTPGHTRYLMADDRRKMRRTCLIWGLVLLALVLFSFCISEGYTWRFYSPLDVISCYGNWFRLQFISIFDNPAFAAERYAVVTAYPMYQDVISQCGFVFRYLFCGAVLAVSGMLYQNVFRNPIAAPSMMGISNGISFGMLIFVLIFQGASLQMKGTFFLFAYGGGIAVLLLVFLVGGLLNGSRNFNLMNLLLMATVISQLLNVTSTYIESEFLTSDTQTILYDLQNAGMTTSVWTYVSLISGIVVAMIPIIALRFRLNLISFSDEETRLLGVNPTVLRVVALACGSLMLLTAQVNIGQVAMASLIVPFITRYIFGSEFRKQLIGNCILGMLVILLCADVTSVVYINDTIGLSLGTVVTFVMLPLFVWMLVIQQRTWEQN